MSAEIHDLSKARFVAPATAAAPLPASVEMEQGVLGSLLLYNETLSLIAPHLREEDFSEEIHRRVYSVATDLLAKGKTASIPEILVYTGNLDLGQNVSLKGYLASLATNALAPAALPSSAKTIHDLAARRALIEAGLSLSDRARTVDLREDASLIATETLKAVQDIVATSGSDTARHIGDAAQEVMNLVDGVRDGSIAHDVVTTGFKELDNATNGYDPGTLWIIAGRPGMGKSVFANASAYRAARSGCGVLEFPLEIGPEQAIARHLADMCYRGRDRSIAFRDIGRRAKELSESDIASLRNAHQALKRLPIIVDKRSRVTVADVAAKVVQTQRAMGASGGKLCVVFIDHLDFIAASDRYRGNRTQEIGEIVIGLKDIARSHGVCIVLMCQLNREAEKRQGADKRPGLSDLRNSGDIEQVADVAGFLYREEYYISRSPEYLSGSPEAMEALVEAQGKLELILGKVRAGPTPTIHLYCDPACSTISGIDRR